MLSEHRTGSINIDHKYASINIVRIERIFGEIFLLVILEGLNGNFVAVSIHNSLQ